MTKEDIQDFAWEQAIKWREAAGLCIGPLYYNIATSYSDRWRDVERIVRDLQVHSPPRAAVEGDIWPM